MPARQWSERTSRRTSRPAFGRENTRVSASRGPDEITRPMEVVRLRTIYGPPSTSSGHRQWLSWLRRLVPLNGDMSRVSWWPRCSFEHVVGRYRPRRDDRQRAAATRLRSARVECAAQEPTITETSHPARTCLCAASSSSTRSSVTRTATSARRLHLGVPRGHQSAVGATGSAVEGGTFVAPV